MPDSLSLAEWLEPCAKAAYAASCAADPIEVREPDWGRGGFKTEVCYWQAVARACLQTLAPVIEQKDAEIARLRGALDHIAGGVVYADGIQHEMSARSLSNFARAAIGEHGRG